MKSLYVTALLALVLGACGPNEFAFEQNSASNGDDPNPPICQDGCTTDGNPNILFDYNEVVPNEKRVDILFIDDNSGSMAEEQKNMSMRFPTFISSLANVSWKIGITSTDIGTTQGKLIEYEGTNLKVIDNATPNGNDLFKQTIELGVNGSGDERGIYAAALAVERNENNWIRSNAHLAVVILSDENEFSNGLNLDVKDMPANLVATVKNQLGANKNFTAHSIITRPNDTVCLNGDGESYGTVYAELSTLTGGVIGDICAADYGAQLAAIAQNIQDSFNTVTLKCEAIESTLAVTYTPAPSATVTTTLNNDKLTFSHALAPGTVIRLKYECPQ